MELNLFHKNITEVLKNYSLTINSELQYKLTTFLKFIDTIFEDKNITPILKMTRMTILFEGFFLSLPDSTFKKNMTMIRLKRWDHHYGTPTVTFLLTFEIQIHKTKLLFSLESPKSNFSSNPWKITSQKKFVIDNKNNVMVNKQSVDSIALPENEKTGELLKTYNPLGGFTTTPSDPVSQMFIESASNGKKILEIGAGFGAASLKALDVGATVFCNDIETKNLAVIKNRYLKKSKNSQHSITGDDSKLVLLPGEFPDELSGLPENFFDAILICRVLHFFSGDKIEQSLQQLLTHLKFNGKLFIVCETPFLKNWQRFIPEHEKRLEACVKWPGEINNPTDYESSNRAISLPKFVHWITKEILERSLIQSNFEIAYLSYIDRKGQFPDDLLLDGKESVGAVAFKHNIDMGAYHE